jgi:hypothetical protein
VRARSPTTFSPLTFVARFEVDTRTGQVAPFAADARRACWRHRIRVSGGAESAWPVRTTRAPSKQWMAMLVVSPTSDGETPTQFVQRCGCQEHALQCLLANIPPSCARLSSHTRGCQAIAHNPSRKRSQRRDIGARASCWAGALSWHGATLGQPAVDVLAPKLRRCFAYLDHRCENSRLQASSRGLTTTVRCGRLPAQVHKLQPAHASRTWPVIQRQRESLQSAASPELWAALSRCHGRECRAFA